MDIFERNIYEQWEYISNVRKYGVVPLLDFGKLIDGNVSDKTIYRTVGKLAAAEVFSKIKINTKERGVRYAIVLSEKFKTKYKITTRMDRFSHDLVLTSVVSNFKSIKGVVDIFMDAEWEKYVEEEGLNATDIVPDAVLNLGSPTSFNESKVAIEVELARKNTKRIARKFQKYAKGKDFSKVFYFIRDIDLWEVFCETLSSCAKSDPKYDYSRIVVVKILNPNKISADFNKLPTYSVLRKAILCEEI